LPWQGEILVDGKDVLDLANILDPKMEGEEEVALSVTEDRLIISSASLLLFVPRRAEHEKTRIEQNLFHIDTTLALIAPVVSFTLERAALTKALEALKVKREDIELSYEKELRLRIPDDDSGRSSAVPAMIEGVLPFPIRTNWNDFKTAVSHFKSKVLRIDLTTTSTPMMLSIEQGHLPESEDAGKKKKEKKPEAEELAITLVSCTGPKEEQEKKEETHDEADE